MKQLLIVLFLVITCFVTAQPPTKFFAKYGGNGVDIGYSVAETFAKQYIIVGSTTSFGSGYSDATLLLLDSMGQVVWQKTYGGVFSDVGKSIIINPADSGFIFSGYSNSYGNGGYDVFVVRTDKNGNLKWQSSFGGFDWDFGNDLTFASDGNIVICGNTFSKGYGKKDGYLIKLNTNNGLGIWEKYYGGSENDDFYSIELTTDGKFSIAGNTQSYGDINNDFWLFKADVLGDSVASVKFGNLNKKEMCYDFMEDNLNNLVFCGSYDTSYYNTGKNVGYIIKTDLNGGFINEVKFNGAGADDKYLSITKSKTGNKYCFARSVFHPAFAIDTQPFLIDYNYNFINSTTYGGDKNDETYKVIATSDDGFLMVGYTKSFNAVSEDIFVVKVDNSLLNAANIVGVNSGEPENITRTIYYYDNEIYFENSKQEWLSYYITNSNGVIIERNFTNKSIIKLDPETSPGIYTIRISNNSSLRYIKNK